MDMEFAEPMTILVGPEGGWLGEELQRFADYGAKRVSLGLRPLRVETAVVALLALAAAGQASR